MDHDGGESPSPQPSPREERGEGDRPKLMLLYAP